MKNLLNFFPVEEEEGKGKLLKISETKTSENGKEYVTLSYSVKDSDKIAKWTIFEDDVLYAIIPYVLNIEEKIATAKEAEDNIAAAKLKSMLEIIETIRDRKVYGYNITIPEGYHWIPVDKNADGDAVDKTSKTITLDKSNANNILQTKEDVIKKSSVERLSLNKMTESELLSTLAELGRVAKG